MIRNLKVLMLAAMVVAAFGAFSASGAQAAQFHCTPAAGQTGCTLTAENDGTGKTAHHVFEIANKLNERTAITCGTITGHATLATTAESITTTTVGYANCTWNGSVAEVKMNGCQYKFNANGGKNVAVVCPAGKEIEQIIPTCTAKIGPQEASGITYHNTTEVKPRTVTLSAAVTVTVNSLVGECGIKLEGPYTGHYTTGNTIIKAEEDPGTKEVDGWWL